MTGVPADAPKAIALSLISHTNAGKTTLARTLLGRDVGEVRDAPHVTQQATAYPLVASPQGDELVLWDTPGFGDSARLAKRLSQQGNPIGWFLSEVWDRFRDRGFWHSQQAVRNVRDSADVVLYLVNASESPDDAGWLGPEMDVLAWVGKPIVVLLNQTGRPRPRDEEAADEARWRGVLADRKQVRDVLALDAFARCWVQEFALFRAIEAALPAARREVFARLATAWRAKRMAAFEQSMQVLAAPIARAALDGETLPDAGMAGQMRNLGRSLGRALGVGGGDADAERDRAASAMSERLARDLSDAAGRLIDLHGLSGEARATLDERCAQGLALDAPTNEGRAAMMGGVVSGAVTGLAADLASGGLTFGAGMLAGAVLGALGGAGLARGMNLARGKSGTTLRWDATFLDGLVAAALLRYLAVAHFGRGRGDWVESESPAFWRDQVATTVSARAATLAALWQRRDDGIDEAALASALTAELEAAARALLDELYPGALDAPVRGA